MAPSALAQKVAELRESGLSVHGTAKALNIARSTVRANQPAHFNQAPVERKALTSEQEADVLKLLRRGITGSRKIGKIIGASEKAVKRFVDTNPSLDEVEDEDIDAEYADVIPIPFYPFDLPRLEITPWPPTKMRQTLRLARRWRLAPPSSEELLAA